jgi:hypothetical protein
MELKTTYFLKDRATDEVHKEQGVTWIASQIFQIWYYNETYNKLYSERE